LTITSKVYGWEIIEGNFCLKDWHNVNPLIGEEMDNTEKINLQSEKKALISMINFLFQNPELSEEQKLKALEKLREIKLLLSP